MSDIQEYKCPCCGGAIEFNSSVQKMKCPFCDTEFDPETLKHYDDVLNSASQGDNMNWDTNAGREWREGETDGMRIYACKSCGGEIIGDENLGATKCPYCDNPVVMMGQFSGSLKPDLVIPFKLDKNAAKAGLEKHISKKKLLPKIFKDKNHIDEIKGVYVPFWLFDAESNGRVNYKATRTRTWSDKDYNYTETNYFSVVRGGNVAFGSVPVDGSTKMPDDLMESIEPFDYSQAVDFQTAYLAGYLADKYDVDAQNSIERANLRIKKSTEDAFASTVTGYNTVTAQSSSIRLSNGRAKYALLPVWLLNTTYNGEKYTFAMNGQTGKFVGNLPIDKGAKWKYQLLYGGIFSAVAYAVLLLLGRL